MGILNGPRINFWGGIQTNVCTTNNLSTEAEIKILDVVAAQVNAACTLTDDQIISKFRTSDEVNNWNYYGDHLVDTVEVTVSSQGTPGNVVTNGDLAGLPVYLLGSIDPTTGQGPFFGAVMVDLDPTSARTTQIFAGGLMIGDPKNPTLHIQHNTFAPNLNTAPRLDKGCPDSPGSSAFSGTFQMSFPKSSVVAYDTGNSLIAGMMNDAAVVGIVLHFSMFEMAPYLTTADLGAAYAANQNPSNPSGGHIVGTIGAQYAGEYDQCPPGRLIQNVAEYFAPFATYPTGYAEVNASENCLSIDTVNLFMKSAFRSDRTAFTDPVAPNTDLGPLTLYAGSNALTAVDASTIGYDLYTDYYLYGGIMDIPVTSSQQTLLAQNPIVLLPQGKTSLSDAVAQESPVRVSSNDVTVYLEGTAPRTVDFTITYLGGPLQEAITLPLGSGTAGALDSPGFLGFPPSVTVAAGASSFSVSVAQDANDSAGFEYLGIASAEAYQLFVYFRKYPVQNFGLTDGDPIPWMTAYNGALRYYYVTFPAMSMRIPLNDEGSIKAMGPQIMARLSDLYRPTTLYMPIVRSMTPSQVHLMNCFLTDGIWKAPVTLQLLTSSEPPVINTKVALSNIWTAQGPANAS